MPTSVVQLHGKLQNSGIARSQNFAEIRGIERRCRVIEVRVIDDVESFKTRLQSNPLSNRESAAQRRIKREVAWTEQGIPSKVPESPERVWREGRWVQPQRDALVSRI